MSPHWNLTTVAAALLIASCPYDGDFPMDEPDVALFEPALLGTWVPVHPDTSAIVRIDGVWLSRLDEDEYRFGFVGCPNSARAWLTRAGGELFLNVSADGKSDFMIAKIVYGPDRMDAFLLEENGLKDVSSAADLHARVERAMRRGATDLFSDTIQLKRAPTGIPAGAAGTKGDGPDCE